MAGASMTTENGRPEPSNKDIFDALQTFGQSYHDLHTTIQRIAQDAEEERKTSRAERTNARVRHEALFRRIDEVASKMEAQFQRAWDELDGLREEFGRRLDQKRERLDAHDRHLDAHDRRLDALEAALEARPTPEKAHATYDGVKRILEYLHLADDDAERG